MNLKECSDFLQKHAAKESKYDPEAFLNDLIYNIESAKGLNWQLQINKLNGIKEL